MADLSLRERRHLVRLRIATALQEIGILELAFAPLDFVVDPRPLRTTWVYVAGFIVAGLLLFLLGVLAERRCHDAD